MNKINHIAARRVASAEQIHNFSGVVVAAAFALLCCKAEAALLFTEEYPTTYGDGTALGSGTTTGGYNTKWPAGNSTGTGNPICTNAGALTYAPLQPISGNPSYGIQLATASSRDQSAGFTQQTGDGNAVYVSFLVKVTAATPVDRNLLGLRNSTGGGTLAAAVGINSSRQLTLLKNGAIGATHATILAQNQTYLVVLRYKFITGSGTDQCALWLNPNTGQADEASAGVTPVTTSTGSDQNGLLSVRLPSTADASGPIYLDEIRIGQSWTDVTPSSGPAIAVKLGFTTQPANAAPGATMSAVVVQTQDSTGGSVASNNVPITLTLSSGSGTLSGTLTRNTDATGKATFNDLSINTAGTGKQLTAAASGIGAGLTSAVSSNFSIIVPSIGTKLAFTTQPTDAQVSATMSAVVVQIQDSSSVAVASNNVPVTLVFTGSGTMGGTLTRNTDATGKATFNDLSVDTVGTGDYLTANASGIGAGLTSATSGSFNITSGGGGGGSGPAIIQKLITPAGFAIVGSNSTPSVLGQLYGSPEVTLPMGQWVLADAHNFDAGGLFTSTNALSPALPKAFYRLSTGGTSTKEEPPTLSGSPGNLTVPAGSNATFSVVATGPLLQYLWFFNNNPINNATNASITISNAQVSNAGSYFCAVANPAGAVSSIPVTLHVGNFAPTITTQPQSQTNTAGGTAIFNVVADGTVPLSYQWFKNTSTPVTGGTNATLTLNNLLTTDAGAYSARVSNSVGFTNSSQASLTVNTVPTAPPDTNMLGFAQVAGVTGGLGGTDVYATNYLSLSNYVRHTEALIIHVTNQITGPGPGVDQYCYVYGNNKTILGEGTNAGINGIDLRLNATNIILANLVFQVTPVGTNDAVTIDGGSKGTGKFIWIDHCTISNAQDGSIDVTKGADYVTISWCKFLYGPKVPGASHEFVHLIGSSDSDGSASAPFHVTLHHNWYADNAIERMPSVRWGRVHVFNCYYTCSGNNYCVRTRIGSQVLVENNFYQTVNDPWESLHTSSPDGLINVSGCITNGCTFNTNYFGGVSFVPGNDSLPYFTPVPYSYASALNTATDVPYYVSTYAGNGKYPYVP